MRLRYVIAVTWMSVPVAMAEPVLYTFSATGGSITLNIAGDASSSQPVAGTFALRIYQEGGHVGAEDTFVMEDCALTNTGSLNFNLAGLATGSAFPAGGIRFLDFAPDGFGIIRPGGQSRVSTDVYLEATTFLSGLTVTTFSTAAWAGTLRTFNLTFGTSPVATDVLTTRLAGTYGWMLPLSEFGLTVTVDFILSVEGTAHVVPDPSLSGVVVLGLAGAGGCLRRRRT
jgi:hypothetical protein